MFRLGLLMLVLFALVPAGVLAQVRPRACPGGYGRDGTCVPTVGTLAAPVLDQAVDIEERVNFNVVGGGVALFVTTYGTSVAYALLANRCGGNVGYGLPYLFPFGSFAGLGCDDWASAATALAFGFGQLIAVFLIAAGDTIFRYRVATPAVAWRGDGLAITF